MRHDSRTHWLNADSDVLDELIPSMTWFATGLLGRSLVIGESQSGQRSLRTIITPEQILLSRQAMEGDAFSAPALYRASLAHAVAHLLYSPLKQPARLLKPMSQAVVAAVEDVRVELLLAKRYPGVSRWFLDHLPPIPEPSNFSFEALISRMDRTLSDPSYVDDNHWVNKARRLFEETRDREGLDDPRPFRAVASILANDLGQMRVRFDPQQFVVPAAFRDDHTILWNFDEDEQIDQQSLTTPPSSPKRADDPLPANSDQIEQVQAPVETELSRTLYAEWNQKLGLWRKDWCTVVEKLPLLSPSEMDQVRKPPRQTFSPVSLHQVRRLSRRQRLRRQWEGEDIDLNAAIEVMVDRRLNLCPEPRLFTRPGREAGTSRILVLLDLSESTNTLSKSQPTSLLEIEKETAFFLAEATLQTQDSVAVHGFNSNTRTEVSYYRLLDWDEPLDVQSRDRLGSAVARHSTRLGAALRHAVSHLQDQPGRHRGLLVVTDGEPSDIDVFEPGYLIEDARKAVQQARRVGIHTFCIAVDPSADSYVKRIFGWRDYGIASDATQLPMQLQRAYTRLASG
jgi:hypothetical protein